MNEIPSALFIFTAIYSFLVWWYNHDNKWLILSAVITGFAASSKIINISHFFLLLVFIFYKILILEKRSISVYMKKTLLFIIPVLLIVLPWYIKSYIHTGNPVWPMMYGWFGGNNWSQYHASQLAVRLNNYGLGKSIVSFMLMPFFLTFSSLKYGSIAGISPIFLIFIPMLLLMGKPDFKFRFLLIYSFIYILTWFFTSQQLRFLIPALAILAIPTAYSIHTIHSMNSNLAKKTIALFMLSFLVFNLVFFIGINYKKIGYISGIQTKDQFYGSLSDYNDHGVFEYLNKNLPTGSKILLFQTIQGYFSDHDYVWGSPSNQAYVNYREFTSDKDLYKRLKDIGITHILVNDDRPVSQTEYNPRIISMMDNLIEKHTNLYYVEEGTKVYVLR
jgi:hypothetical protein